MTMDQVLKNHKFITIGTRIVESKDVEYLQRS